MIEVILLRNGNNFYLSDMQQATSSLPTCSSQFYFRTNYLTGPLFTLYQANLSHMLDPTVRKGWVSTSSPLRVLSNCCVVKWSWWRDSISGLAIQWHTRGLQHCLIYRCSTTISATHHALFPLTMPSQSRFDHESTATHEDKVTSYEAASEALHVPTHLCEGTSNRRHAD